MSAVEKKLSSLLVKSFTRASFTYDNFSYDKCTFQKASMSASEKVHLSFEKLAYELKFT